MLYEFGIERLETNSLSIYSGLKTEDLVQIFKEQKGTLAKGISPPNLQVSQLSVICILRMHLQALCLNRSKTLAKIFPYFSLKKKKSENLPLFLYLWEVTFSLLFSPGTLLCLNIKVYKSILKYGILRMFQSKVKLVLKTLLVKAKITVWLNSLKCS